MSGREIIVLRKYMNHEAWRAVTKVIAWIWILRRGSVLILLLPPGWVGSCRRVSNFAPDTALAGGTAGSTVALFGKYERLILRMFLAFILERLDL